MQKNKRVLVAMSGGVDSSVAAALLQEQGYEVIGVTMQVWDYSVNQSLEYCSANSSVNSAVNSSVNSLTKKNFKQNNFKGHNASRSQEVQEDSGTCCSSLDVDDARAVCDVLNIPFYIINCEKEFKTKVIDHFVQSYLQGKTPVPCVDCNTYLKFDYLIKKMKELKCDYLATGHYAKILQKNQQTSIVTSKDSWKDQTYFLFGLDKNILKHLLFPVGGWSKEQTRQYAKDKKLPVYNKKDSVGICFVGKNEYATFIEDQLKKTQTPATSYADIKKGHLLKYPCGSILGQHQGIHKFTYGQRKALGVNSKTPLYVIKINPQTGDVWLGEDKYLYQKVMGLKDFNWLVKDSSKLDLKKPLDVKIRFHHQGAKGILKKENQDWVFYFQDAQRAITPGQAAVFYQDKHLLGGAWISKVIEQKQM